MWLWPFWLDFCLKHLLHFLLLVLPPLCVPHNLLKALLNSLFCLSPLLLPYPLPLPQFLLVHKHIALMGPAGLWGYAISSHINNPTAIHNMHAFFPLCFPPMYIFTPWNRTDFWVSNGKGQNCRVFVGITILFSTKQSRLSWATVYRQFGLDCFSGQRQFNQRGERTGLSYRSECYAGRGRKFDLWGPNWTRDPTVCECVCVCGSYMEMPSFAFAGLWLLCNCKCKSCFCRTFGDHCISESIKSCI